MRSAPPGARRAVKTPGPGSPPGRPAGGWLRPEPGCFCQPAAALTFLASPPPPAPDSRASPARREVSRPLPSPARPATPGPSHSNSVWWPRGDRERLVFGNVAPNRRPSAGSTLVQLRTGGNRDRTRLEEPSLSCERGRSSSRVLRRRHLGAGQRRFSVIRNAFLQYGSRTTLPVESRKPFRTGEWPSARGSRGCRAGPWPSSEL